MLDRTNTFVNSLMSVNLETVGCVTNHVSRVVYKRVQTYDVLLDNLLTTIWITVTTLTTDLKEMH